MISQSAEVKVMPSGGVNSARSAWVRIRQIFGNRQSLATPEYGRKASLRMGSNLWQQRRDTHAAFQLRRKRPTNTSLQELTTIGDGRGLGNPGHKMASNYMDFTKDKALDMIMSFPSHVRAEVIALAEELAGMETNYRAELKQAVAWIEKYSVQPQEETRRGVRGPDRAPRKRKPKGSVTNAAEA